VGEGEARGPWCRSRDLGLVVPCAVLREADAALARMPSARHDGAGIEQERSEIGCCVREKSHVLLGAVS